MINTLGNNILNPSVYSNCQKYASYRVVSNESRVNIYIFTHIYIFIFTIISILYLHMYIFQHRKLWGDGNEKKTLGDSEDQ